MPSDSLRPTEPDLRPDSPIPTELDRLQADKRKKGGRFALAALSSIPWVGGFLSAAASLDAEVDQGRVNLLQRQWLEEHERKLAELSAALNEIAERISGFGTEAEARSDSEEYFALVRKGFEVWNRADTREKRELIQRLLMNAAGTSVADDDLVRLFIEWIDTYHEAHFSVVREIYRNPLCTRADIWDAIYGRAVKENSAEADLFKLLIRDLSTGSVIRQHRPTGGDGQFLRKPRSPSRRVSASPYAKSAFDDTDEYELTELGKQFVHYVLTDAVPRIGTPPTSSGV